MLIDNPEELLDLVNEHDEVIGKIYRAKVPQLSSNGKGYVRAVGVFLQNANNQLFIPARSLKKKLLPGAYDFSAAGHVCSGQSYEEAAFQETAEELNIVLTKNELKFVGALPPMNGVPYFNHIFIVSYNKTPLYNKDDFYKAEWLYPEELIANINSGHPAKQVIVPSLELLKNT
jgi:isopentenyl-diphosphate delta-isomerase